MDKKTQHGLSGLVAIVGGMMFFFGMSAGSLINDSALDGDYSLTYEIQTISSDAEVVFGESTVKGIGDDEMSFDADDYSVGDKVRVYFDNDGKVVRKMEVD